MGIYGKPGPEDFAEDYNHWRRVVSTTYLNELGFGWENVRNIMDMRAVYGGYDSFILNQSHCHCHCHAFTDLIKL